MKEQAMDAASKRWAGFCDSIRDAGQEILRSAEGADPVSQAEGLRYLTRLLRSGIEKFVEYSDPDDPYLANVYNDRLKWGLDNPDSLYAIGAIKDDTEYRITGNIGTVNYFNFTSAIMSTDAKYQITGVLDSPDVVADADGNFTVHVGGPRRAQNWVPLAPGSNSIMVRQTFADRARETEMAFRIEQAGRQSPARPITIDRALEKISQAESFFCNTGRTFVSLADRIGKSVNQLPLVDQAFMLSMGGDPNYAYFWGGFRIEPGEALLIHFRDVPGSDTWSLCLYSYWLESLDYTRALVNLNKHLAQPNADGSLTIVVAAEAPGVPNWLDTQGHIRGNIMSRWVNPDHVTHPSTALVRLDEVDWAARLRRWPTETGCI